MNAQVSKTRPGQRRRSPKQRALAIQRQKAKEMDIVVLPAAGPAKPRKRHWALLASFLVCVVFPAFLIGSYLYTRAADQYASHVGFTVRQTTATPAFELLGGLTDLSGSNSTDVDILNSYLSSQELVRQIDGELDLVSIWSRAENDPIFAFDSKGSIEDLVTYWNRMVSVSYDSGAELIEVRTLAFDPDSAKRINTAIIDAGSKLINDLSDIAREDTTRYSKVDLERAVQRLKDVRIALTEFRNINQIVDPDSAIQGQIGLMNTLQQQLAAAVIEMELLIDTTRPNDPRISQAERRIEVIENQIEEERTKLGFGEDSQGSQIADVVGEYESLLVDLEFAQVSYTTALASYDNAVAEAGRQSRYLATFKGPSLSETAQFPKRNTLFALSFAFLFLGWALGVLIYYSLKDRQSRI